MMFVALVGLIFRQRASQAFWGGFALLGWGYLLLAFGPWCKDNVSPQLLTTKLLDYLHAKLQRSTPAVTPAVPTVALIGCIAAFAQPPPVHFMQVGHSLWAFFFASAGGLLARHFYDRRTRPEQEDGAGT